ncbi:hypothetical protein BHE74_00031290, partial [Ensete ventricosum]
HNSRWRKDAEPFGRCQARQSTSSEITKKGIGPPTHVLGCSGGPRLEMPPFFAWWKYEIPSRDSL